jgi:hypothetical protein
MKKARKLLVALLVLTFLLGTFNVGFAADRRRKVATTPAVDKSSSTWHFKRRRPRQSQSRQTNYQSRSTSTLLLESLVWKLLQNL